MAKVYEALQKAEEERRRRQAHAAPAPPVQWAEELEPRPHGRIEIPFWKRWFGRSHPHQGAPGTAADFNRRRIALLQPDSYVAEQFRTLRARIDSLAQQRPLKTLAVTSANIGEGKSTAAVNLATVIAMSVARRTLIVDCDLRQPQVHRSLDVDLKAGLAEVLLDEASLDEAIRHVAGIGLDVLGVRAQPKNPSELLASSRMVKLVEEIAGSYDRVILDTPATLGLPDSKIVSDLCDGMILVVRANVTPREDVEATLDVLDRRRLLGMVLNGGNPSRSGYDYYWA